MPLSIHKELVPGTPADTETHGRSSPLYKTAEPNAYSQPSASVDSQPQTEKSTGIYWNKFAY